MLSRRAFLGGLGLGALALAGCDPMTLARRLLLAGGGGAFVVQPLYPPTDDSWARSGVNPFFHFAVEPTVTFEDGTWKMWYRTDSLNYATSTDGETFTNYGSNPVFGQGGSGFAGNVWLPWVIKIDGTYHLSFITDDFSETYAQATSPDGITWTQTSPTISLPPGCNLWGNKCVWKEGSTWYMLHEAAPTGQFWRIYLYSSSDGLVWSIQNGGAVVNGLQVAANGMYGGPRLANLNGTVTPKWSDDLYHLWFHAAPAAGNLPTDIYHATSPDRIEWTITTPSPVLEHLGPPTFEYDQVADCCPLVVGNTAYLYYDGVDNVGHPTPFDSYLGVATAPAATL